MKKKWMAVLAVLLLATLTACGGGGADTDNGKDDDANIDTSGKFDNYKSGQFVEMMESGTYYLDCSAYVMGIETSMKMAVDGKDSSVEVSGVGFPVRMLTLDGKMYYMNDDKKVYMVLEGEEAPDPTDNGVYDFDGIKFGKNGTGPISDLAGIDDNSYDYEEFTVDADGDKAVARYYFKGDNLYAIEVKIGDMGSTMVINEMTKNIPDGLMKLPSGYEEVDATAFF